MAERYFENIMTIGPELDGDDVTRTILKAAAAALKEVKARAAKHRDVSGGGVYVGLGGVGLTYLRMAQQVQRGFKYVHSSYLQKHSVSHSLDLAGRFFQDADALMAQKRVTFLEGASGLLACRAVLAHMNGDAAALNTLLQELCALWDSRIVGVLADSECEVLYGRAGYLYSLTWARQQLGTDSIPQQLIKAAVRHILDEGIKGAAELQQGSLLSAGATAAAAAASPRWGLMYSWHNKRYLGAAHGVSGILYVLLHHLGIIRQLDAEQQQQQQQQQHQTTTRTAATTSAAAAGAAAATRGGGGSPGCYMSALVSSVEALAASALPSGNLPTKLGDREDIRVAWCHGAAGFIPTLLKAADALGDPQGRYMAAATAAADDIWHRGLLRKGVGLCHSISGNGYALLAMARATGQPHYLRAARAFALFGAEHWQELYDVPDRPASLFEGAAGAVNFWLDVVDPKHSKWPGAEL